MNEPDTACQSRMGLSGNPAQPDAAGTIFRIKHNRQVYELSLPELLSAAQKGLDYDRIRPSHEFVKRLAAQQGEPDVAKFLEKAGPDCENRPDASVDLEQTQLPPVGGRTNTDLPGNPLSRAAPQTATQAPAPSGTKDAENGNGERADVQVEYLPSQKGPDTLEASDPTEALRAEYPGYFRGGEAHLPAEVQALVDGGLAPLEACRLDELRRTRGLCRELQARLDARQANRENEVASTGALTGGEPAGKDFYSSKEWDSLAPRQKETLIRNGKIYDFMKKWGGGR